MPGLTLAAALIVRNEADQLPDCLAALRGVVDEVVIYDTGSTDGSIEVAGAAGARVLAGHWDGDFARARNAALAACTADWVLSVDADERVQADPAGLRGLLQSAGTAELFGVRIHNQAPAELGGRFGTVAPRLLRRAGLRWVGRVHERPRRLDGGKPRVAACPPEALSLLHLGYADAAQLRAKSRRNAELGQRELDALLGAQPRDDARLAEVLLDLGRSLVGCGEQQRAVDSFEVVRDLAPGSAEAVQATDALAGVLLAAGHDELVLVLAAQLREAGVPAGYCNWLRAQALTQLGRAAEALDLLRGVDALVDATGRELDLGPLLEARALVAGLVGERDEAVECLVRTMAGHGRIRGRGELLAGFWGQHPADELVGLVRRWGPDRAGELARELAEAPEPGPALSAALSGTPSPQ